MHKFKCKCCGNENYSSVTISVDNSGSKINVYECKQCAALVPEYSEIRKVSLDTQIHFHENYWEKTSPAEMNQVAEDLRHTVNFYERLEFLSKKDSKKNTILEIGSGRGCLLEALIREGYSPLGCEPSHKLSNLANEIYGFKEGTLVCCEADSYIEKIRAEGGRFNIIFMWHVIEHISDALTCLKSLLEILDCDGVVIAQVPTMDHRYLYPEHQFLFTENTVVKIAHLAGYDLVFSDLCNKSKFLSFVLKKPNTINNMNKLDLNNKLRSENFNIRTHNRYWWYKTEGCTYVPNVFASLDENEWDLINEWFNDTEKNFPSTGELSIPGISLLNGIISGNGISSIVQCGHYIGFSTLLLGFLLRKMRKYNSLFSVDIDPVVTDYTSQWINRAGLKDYVRLEVNDSANPLLPTIAKDYFGRDPQLVFIDSSHQYKHTLKELDIWYQAIVENGFILLHDVSQFASTFDSTEQGGVYRAINEWCEQNRINPLLINSNNFSTSPSDLVYRDGCGMGIIQKKELLKNRIPF
jgi:predicted O-methyltransferase YrrM/2-polyprenyl-3-methyl-5-hydroxy-6-metoxy-1,4-benzoquinol methylase